MRTLGTRSGLSLTNRRAIDAQRGISSIEHPSLFKLSSDEIRISKHTALRTTEQITQPTTSLGDRNKEEYYLFFSLALLPDSRAGNVLINSKLQHPPRATTLAFELLRIGLYKFTPLPSQNRVLMLYPRDEFVDLFF